MNQQLPYETELAKKLATLVVPDENRAWEDMLARLDKEDDDGIVVLPIRKGCATWFTGIFLLLLGAGIFTLWNNSRHRKPVEKVTTTSDNHNLNLYKKQDSGNTIKRNETTGKTNPPVGLPQADTMEAFSKDTLASTTTKSKKIAVVNPQMVKRKASGRLLRETGTNISDKTALENVTVKGNRRKKTTAKTYLARQPLKNDQRKTEILEDGNGRKKPTPLIASPINIPLKNAIDSTGDTITVTSKNNQATALKKVPKKTLTGTNKDKKEDTSKNNLSFAAGVSLYQQIPFDGQSAVPYNAQGRSLSLLDYIPAVYFRVYKKQKAFLQIAFRYGAPQLTKEFTYNTKIVKDSASSFDTTTTRRLKKTYYHQLPVSLHYQISSHFSGGIGLMWSKFGGAVAEQQVNTTNRLTGITKLVSSNILEVKKDSSFTSSNLQALFNIGYTWKRFSLGAMYTFGLQPYIKYQSADGKPQQQKNTSLQVYLQYELWRSKRKK